MLLFFVKNTNLQKHLILEGCIFFGIQNLFESIKILFLYYKFLNYNGFQNNT